MCKIYTRLIFIEKIPEVMELVLHGIAPVVPIMQPGPLGIFMGDLQCKHLLVKPAVAFNKNVADAAVEDDSKGCAGIFINDAGDRIIIPVL